MRKESIVKKQMLQYIGTIVICVLILGGILSVVYTQHYMKEKRNELIQQGRKVSAAFSNAYRTGNLSNLSYELQVLEEYMGAGILMVNSNGVVVLASPGLDEMMIGQSFAYDELVAGVKDGNIVSMETKAAGLFDVPMLVVGYPLSVGEMAGIFMCRSMPEMEQSLYQMYQVGVVSIFVVFLFAIVVSYATSKKMTRPIKEMNEAAKVIASGNFDHRVDIISKDELGELAKSFNDMAESLQNNDKTRRDFIANVSHDLRSPLTSMQGFLTAMLDGTVPIEKQERYLQIVLEETMRLSRLTEGIVDLSRAESSKIILDESDFDLNGLIRDNINLLEPQLNEKNAVIKAIFADQVTIIHGDVDKISRVIQNLLSNAVKFSPVGGLIEVETTKTERKKVLVSIKDHGIGIRQEDQKYIFDRFYKADRTRNQDMHGSGIGLAIVREFLQAHDEGITVKSVEGEGSTFIFSLKLAEE
ncbi:HAMP domain-containing sensor histidine kinase [Anaerotignum sp.]|uniref:HAMP domain-containing sensor histidine kinase n=1 Tax=Anaerotignum sp. TaxID=2039241 RepID=UPI002715436E|nr:HAMP domain-containing sensor histidine kinase [Anaerotignum sp.]